MNVILATQRRRRPIPLCYRPAMLHRRRTLAALRLAVSAALAAGCAPEPPPGPETDLVPQHEAEWQVALGGRLILSGVTLTYEATSGSAGQMGENAPGVTILADELVGVPALSADGARWTFSRRGPGPGLSVLDRVELTEEGLQQTTLVTEGAPDRVAISADGAWVAWVSGVTGIASVWAMPFAGGAAVQLTNRDLVRVIGEEPVGFVPPPHLSPLQIEGDGDGYRVRWTSPAGPHEVPLP